jgi:hydrogenase maturation protein HypF
LTSTEAKRGASLHVSGIVQGVGFRPFVYNLSRRLGLLGWVRNTSAGVDIEVDGTAPDLEAFIKALRVEAPPLARIDDLTVSDNPLRGFTTFEILDSESIPEAFQPISPDVAICDDCLREMRDPHDRRFRYPFINCTNCGPRFTIIRDIPYDRPKTTMAHFAMCNDCRREYSDPGDRRFHAQPVACPACGPQVWLEYAISNGVRRAAEKDAAVLEAGRLLAEGRIVAVKGLGGFHLACDAIRPDTVQELRRRKLRVDKPFALMFRDMMAVEHHCFVDSTERAALISAARPIVLLRRRPESGIAVDVAPGQGWLGVMLPYTPLHHLLLETADGSPDVLVMTSGNLSEEPICTGNDEARQRLATLADAFLMHDRDIHVRCDDSVLRVFVDPAPGAARATGPEASIYPLRRSRGFAPFPVRLPWQVPPLLATGAELKNTFCITNRNYGFLSQHIGDMQNFETLQSFEQSVEHFEALFRVRPEAVAYDLHPDYLASRYASSRADREGLAKIGIQHHHAHIAACMAEHGLDGVNPVLGVAMDGTGYGEDGAIWGGEFLVANYVSFRRALHLEYFPLPGGDAAIREPARIALALLWSLGLEWAEVLAPVRQFPPAARGILTTQLERRINAPLTSSMGRLFDAAAALAGVRQTVNYEAQAAIEFEALADESEAGAYPFEIDAGLIRLKPGIQALLADVLTGLNVALIAARFHNGLAHMILSAARGVRSDTGVNAVVLSGGVWQNITLLRRTLSLLRDAGFQVYIHREVPTNDGGLALGQAAIAAARLRAGYVPGSPGSDNRDI